MPILPEMSRVPTLREWGISEPLIRLSCGEELHTAISIGCQGPPWYVYHGSVNPPRGPALAVLWEWSEQVTGVWRQKAGLEFIRFGFGCPDEFEVLAHTEQGFWVTQFDFFYESDAQIEGLREAASIVGFRFFDQYLASREAAENQLDTFEGHWAWRSRLVACIDQEVIDQP